MRYHAIQCHTMQYHAISCNTMQYHAKPCNTMQYHAIPCKTMQYHAKPCNAMQYYAYFITADGAYQWPLGSMWPFFLSKLAKTKVALEISINVMKKSLENMPFAEFLSIQTCNFSPFRREQTIMQNVVGATLSDMLNRSRFGIFFLWGQRIL